MLLAKTENRTPTCPREHEKDLKAVQALELKLEI